MRSTTYGTDNEDLSGTLVQSDKSVCNMIAISLMEGMVISVQEVALHPYQIYWYDRSGETSFIQWKMTKSPRTHIPSPHLYQYGEGAKCFLWS